MTIRIVYIVLTFFLAGKVEIIFAQSVVNELKKIKATDSACTNISMSVSYYVYTNYVTKVPYEKMRGAFKRRGNNYLSDIGGIKTIQNESILFSVDTISEQIIVGDHQTRLKRLAGIELDTLIPFFTQTSIADLANGQRMISLVFKEGHEYEYEKIQLFYSRETYFISKVTLFYSNEQSLDEEEDLTEEKPRMEILFQNINTKDPVPLTAFSEKNYMQLVSGGAIGIGKYEGYEIMDDRNASRNTKVKGQ